MDIVTAQDMVASAPEQISTLRNRLADWHNVHPQRAALADLALKEIEQALEKLVALGHCFFLTEQPSTPPDTFPMMLYRDTATGMETRTVETQGEVDVLQKDGWRVHPSLPDAPIPLSQEDATAFPVHLYRHSPFGGEDEHRAVTNQEELDAALQDGWMREDRALPLEDRLVGHEPPVGGEPRSIIGLDGPHGLPVDGAAGVGSHSGGSDLSSHDQTEQRQQMAEADAAVEHHDS